MSPRQHWLAAIAAFISAFFIAATAPAQDLTQWSTPQFLFQGGDSSVVQLPDGRVRIYYIPPSTVSTGGTISAISNDGVNFTIEPGTRLPFSAGGLVRVVPLPNGQWRMFYAAQVTQGGSAGGIGSAISPDGLNFTVEPGLRIAANTLGLASDQVVQQATVVTMPDGTFRMYFIIESRLLPPNPSFVKSATSTDMLTWTVEQGVRLGPGSTLSNSAADSNAMANGDGSISLLYWHESFSNPNDKNGQDSQINIATAADGINFTKQTITSVSGPAVCSPCGDPSVYRMSDGRLRLYYNNFVSLSLTNLFSAASNQIDPGAGILVSSVLPSSRSVQVGSTATAFATIINAGLSDALACTIVPAASLSGTFSYQTTNSATNAPTGSPNTPVNIPKGQAQSFVIAVTPTSAISAGDIQFGFQCRNSGVAPSSSGLNTLYFSASSTPTPDVIALGATPSSDGILNITGTTGSSAFAVATANVGAAGAITATADTGSATLPLTLTICQTNPSNGACLSPPGPSAMATIAANATPTFSIFAQGSGTTPFSPGTNRIFVKFKDGGGVTRGSTSVAVRTQ